MGTVRQPAVAGTFYPRNAVELRAAVRRYVALAGSPDDLKPKAVIVPHAGYVYSGPIAGTAFARLAPLHGQVRRVVLVGPAHRAVFTGLALPEATSMATPLGPMAIDPAARAALLELPQVIASDRAHGGEHSLEVQLPFVQELLGDVSIVPLVVGLVTDALAAQAIDRVWGGPETCIVVSSDLSHYYGYMTGRGLDRETAHAIEELSPRDIHEEQACGGTAVRALLLVARERGLNATTLDLRSSGDTSGPRDSVVGYGAFCFA
jgi:AmmeMemoRadiSam system protein B